MASPDTDFTRTLCALAGASSSAATAELLPLVYDELRALARRQLSGEAPGATLGATALVHEAWMRLVGDVGPDAPAWSGRRHFFGAAARAMRRILVEHARARAAQKRGGAFARVELSESVALTGPRPADVLDLDAALERLSEAHPRPHEVVLLRHFGGLTLAEVGALLELSPATVKDDWAFARAWLARELARGAREGGD